MAQEILKDPYSFDFLTIREECHEKNWKTHWSAISRVFYWSLVMDLPLWADRWN